MHKKIKIYIFHPYSSIGGADTSLSRLVNNLNNKDYSIDFITLNNHKLNLKKKKIKIIKIKSSRTIFSIFKIRKYLIKDRLKNYNKYIFFSNQNFANIISFIILFRLNWIKNILIERNHLDEFKYIKNIKNLIIKILIKLLYKNANKVIGVSKKLSKDLSIYTNAQVRTIYDPAYDKELKFVSKKKIFKRNLKKKIILNIARLEEQKDHLTLLKGFKESLKKIKSTLIIIGYGSKEKEINNFIKENKLTNDVIVMKNIHNPYPFLKSADLFILTSLYEGFGIVLVEAAAHRIPIISTNCNSGPSEILLNGKGGDLIKIKDHKTLSKKIIENLSKKNLKKINIAYKNIKNYSTEVIINQYDKLFKKI